MNAAATVLTPSARASEQTTSKHVPPARATGRTTPIRITPAQAEPDPAYAAIRQIGRALNDLEALRIATANRIHKLEVVHRDVLPQLAVTDGGITDLEDLLVRDLLAAWRTHPLRAWQTETVGIGDKTLARLVAEIGDPSLRPIGSWAKTDAGTKSGTDRVWVIEGYEERTLAQLRAFCGHGDPARARIGRGASQEELMRRGSPQAKMRTYLIAEGCAKLDGTPDKNGRTRGRSPFREVYDARRVETAERVHESPCVRCGPSGSPAKAGSLWSKGHQHQDALRIVGKEILSALWVEARYLRD
jgi:hypothetical protein